jgi:hypothetical protein
MQITKSLGRLRIETEAWEAGTVKVKRSGLSIPPRNMLLVACLGTARDLLTPL